MELFRTLFRRGADFFAMVGVTLLLITVTAGAKGMEEWMSAFLKT